MIWPVAPDRAAFASSRPCARLARAARFRACSHDSGLRLSRRQGHAPEDASPTGARPAPAYVVKGEGLYMELNLRARGVGGW